MRSITVFAALVGFVACSYNNGQQLAGRCSADGYYYNDESSVMLCSNGNAYRMPCAPGSKNSNSARSMGGANASYRDFCDINLVDTGFNLRNGYSSAPQTSYQSNTNTGYGSSSSNVHSSNSYGASQGQSYGASNSAPHGNGNSGYGAPARPQATGYGKQPQGYASQPKGYASQPQGYASQPQGYANQPQGYASQPKGYASQPQGYASQPKGYASQPKGYANQPQGYASQPQGYGSQGQMYMGQFSGSCNGDGLYYNDDTSFMVCANGNSYMQRCAPGSKNSGSTGLSTGGYASVRDFCDVNLVDQGFNLQFAHRGSQRSYH